MMAGKMFNQFQQNYWVYTWLNIYRFDTEVCDSNCSRTIAKKQSRRPIETTILFKKNSSPGIWIKSSDVVPTTLSYPTMNGTILPFTFQHLSSSSFRPWYFFNFPHSFLMLLSFGTVILITTAVLWFLYYYHNVWLMGQQLPVPLDMEIPQDFSFIILHDFLCNGLSGLRKVYPIHYADVLVNNLVVPFSMQVLFCLHTASSHYEWTASEAL